MKKQTIITYALLGMLGGILTMTGDYLLEYLGGLPSETLGVSGMAESAWLQMAGWRLPLSIVFGVIGSVLFVFGYSAVFQLLKKAAPTGAQVVRCCGLFGGTVGGTMIHVTLCLMPVVFQTVAHGAGLTLAVQTIDNAFAAMDVVFWVFYLCLLVPFLVWTYLVVRRKSNYSRWMSLPVIPLCIASLAISTLLPGLEWLKVGAISRMYVFLFALTALQAGRERK